MDCDSLERSSGNIQMNSREENSSKIVLKYEKFETNCQFLTKTVGLHGCNEDWRNLLKSFSIRFLLKYEKSQWSCWLS